MTWSIAALIKGGHTADRDLRYHVSPVHCPPTVHQWPLIGKVKCLSRESGVTHVIVPVSSTAENVTMFKVSQSLLLLL